MATAARGAAGSSKQRAIDSRMRDTNGAARAGKTTPTVSAYRWSGSARKLKR